jgi:hypothetical protein
MSRKKKSKPVEFTEANGRRVVKSRDGVCARCRRGGALDWDHRKNRSQGGLWAPSNGQLLCSEVCHPWKTTHPKEATEQGLSVPSWAHPHMWPVLRWKPTSYGTVKQAWALLDNEGGVTWIGPVEAQARLTGHYPGVSIYADRTVA